MSSVCGKSNADIVFLVDESSSIGANNFIKMKDFIFRVATYFPVIGPQATQVRVSLRTSVVLLCQGSSAVWILLISDTYFHNIEIFFYIINM